MTTLSFEKMVAEASKYILLHHVSIGNSFANPNIPLPPPNGSATFVRFKIEVGIVYGILTAAHVARWLKFGRNNQGEFIGLSKLQNNDSIACSVTFNFIHYIAPKDRFHMFSNDAYRPDIAFIALGINQFPNHDLLENSVFYDLDSNIEFGFTEDQQILSAFFRGACHDWEISDDCYLNTPICLGGGEVIKHDNERNIQYWKIPNTSKKSIGGSSGAGFWRFRYENGILRKSLEGVIIAEGKNCNFIEAMATPFLYDIYLPQLKHFCISNSDWFL
jgi:hypothetical protein